MDSPPGTRGVVGGGGRGVLIRRTSRYNNNENSSLCLNTCRSGCVLALLSVLWLFISVCVCFLAAVLEGLPFSFLARPHSGYVPSL